MNATRHKRRTVRRCVLGGLFALVVATASLHGAEGGSMAEKHAVPRLTPNFEQPWPGYRLGAGHSSPNLAAHGRWKHGVDAGFAEDSWHTGFSLGVGLGMLEFGGRERHDLFLGTAHVGRIMSDVVAKDRWYRGNWDLLGEFFAGRQLNPHGAYVVGFTPILRYNFAHNPNPRWVPFLEGGVGVSGTNIGRPDLATWLEFHPVGGGGVQWFCCDNFAATLNYRFAHLSNAGIKEPNRGLNTSVLLLGLTSYF